LLQALAGQPAAAGLRVWWLSSQGQPVEAEVGRPEVGLLAGVCEVGPQETGVDGRWLDLPGPDLTDWAGPLAALLAETAETAGTGPADAEAAGRPPRRLALRQGYWWQQQVLPVAVPPSAPHPAAGLPVDGGVYLVLGGTGGIGSSIAAWLLEQADCRLVLLARKPELPAALVRWADRIELFAADLSAESAELLLERLARHLPRLDGIVHAAGAAAGSLIARRDAAAMRAATAAKLTGCLLVEGLIQRHQPAFAAYCSSMSALFGGIGQLDYAAGNGALDGFARYRAGAAETTVRLGIDFDIWSEVGMAQAGQQALRSDARHQAHLAVGLSVAEGQRVFARALWLQLPQLLVSTTALEQSRAFYAPAAGEPVGPLPSGPADAEQATAGGAEPAGSVAEQLADCLCRWLGVDQLDPAASLYDLGADSLVLLDLIGEVKQRFGVDIELARLSHRASLAEVLAQYQAITGTVAPTGPMTAERAASEPAPAVLAAAELVTLDVWQAGTGTGTELLCLIHPVGGDIQAYRSLVSALDPRLTVCLIADPALFRPELPPWSVAERARYYAAALRERFPRDAWRWRLAGWSFGGWVALTMAADCEAAGQPVAGLYLLDPPPPGSGADLWSYDEDQLRAMFALELGSNGTSGATSEAAAYAERLARCCRANLASMAEHRLPALTGTTAGTPVELWLATRPVPGLPAPLPAAERQRLWQPLLPGLAAAGCHLLDTTHDGIVGAPAAGRIASLINGASLPAPDKVLTPGRTS
jgi:thioesterase domain-containing protein/acyl carrier protein